MNFSGSDSRKPAELIGEALKAQKMSFICFASLECSFCSAFCPCCSDCHSRCETHGRGAVQDISFKVPLKKKTVAGTVGTGKYLEVIKRVILSGGR